MSTELSTAVEPGPKKRRFLYETALDLSKNSAQARFLSFHFQILQTLHADDDADDGSAIEASTWTLIESFLKQRERLITAKKEVVCMQGIYKESLQYFTEQQSCDNMSIQTTPRRHHLPKPSPVFSHYPLMSQASVSSVVHNDQNSQNFEIIARLLGRRHKIVEQEFQKIGKESFEPLLLATEARVEQLRKEQSAEDLATSTRNQKCIQDLLAVNIYKEKQPRTSTTLEGEETSKRSNSAKLECKIRLWSLLAHDLRHAIMIVSPSFASESVSP